MKARNLADRKHNNAYVIFTREPVPGHTKTRLMPYYSAEQCAGLHKCFLKDLAHEMKRSGFDIIVAYTGGEPAFLRKAFGKNARFIMQRGDDLGQKMENAFADAFDMGYKRVVLTGTDIPELKADTINAAFDMIDLNDIVLGPTADGGYYLIGMSSLRHEAFDVKLYGVATVFEETVRSIREAGLSVGLADKYSDIDDRDDIADLMNRLRQDRHAAGKHTRDFLRENMKISVIIPVFNEEETVKAMIDQLKPFRDELEIVFVDGHSTDGTVEMIGDEFRVFSCEKSRGRQLNAGAMASCGDVLFFLHCDSVLPKDFVNEIKRCMMKKPYGCFGVKFDSHNFFMLTNRVISNHRAAIRGIPFGDQGIFIDRKLFFNQGMFQDIPLMEDYEFSLKMKRNGLRPGMTRKRIITSSRRYGRGTQSILSQEYRMWKLRMLYRRGKPSEELAALYCDKR